MYRNTMVLAATKFAESASGRSNDHNIPAQGRQDSWPHSHKDFLSIAHLLLVHHLMKNMIAAAGCRHSFYLILSNNV